MNQPTPSRRAFLRRAALAAVAAPAIWVPRRAAGQLNSPGFVSGLVRPAGGPATSCQLLVEQTVDTDYIETSSGAMAQRIKFAGGTVCQIDLLLKYHTANGKVKVECWSSATRTGTQYGSASNEIDTSTGYSSAAWGTFTFATNPAPTGDFWICLVRTGTGDTQWRADYSHANGSSWYPYTNSTDDQAYCAWFFGSNRTTTDFCFKLYTDQ